MDRLPIHPFTVSFDDDYSVAPDFLPISGRNFLTEAMSKIEQPAGGRYRERQRAARGASRHDVQTPRHHSITVAAAHVTRPGGLLPNPRDGLPFDPGRTFKRHRPSHWVPGIRRADWAFAPLAAARGTSTLPIGGSCTCLRRWADRCTTGGRVNSRY